MLPVRTLICAFSVIFLARSVTPSKTKRILLNDPDLLNAKLLNLEKRINELETENSHLKQLNGGQRIQTLETESINSKQQNLGPRVNELENENSRLRQLVNTVSSSQSATFVRWGRKDCPSLNGTVLVYSGITGGGAFNEKGSGANMLCLPHNPDSLSVVPTGVDGFARVYGTEYQFSYKNVVGNDDVPCAVCHVRTATSGLMIPAKSSCPSGWLQQYNGMLVGEQYGYARSEFVCLDIDPEYFERGRGNLNGNLFHPAVGICGSLPCPSYTNNKVLPCVLCTK